VSIGLLLAIVSGACFGVCFLPVRYMNKFAWENIWFVYSLFGVVIFPILLGCLTIPSIVHLYREVDWRINLIVVAAGLLSGAGVIMYGQSLIRIGMALVNALSNGVSRSGRYWDAKKQNAADAATNSTTTPTSRRRATNVNTGPPRLEAGLG